MNQTLSACFAVIAQAFMQCAATMPSDAATVMPIWQNDTVANTMSFQDTFGHLVSIGTYNSSTGVWSVPIGSFSLSETFTGGLISVAGSPAGGGGTFALTVAGTSGGIPYFASGTTWASSAVLAANQIVLGGGAGVAPATLGSLGTTTTLLHGNAAGAPSFAAVSATDIAAALASGTDPASFTTLAASGAVSGAGFTGLFAAPPPIGNTTPNTGAFTNFSANGTVTFSANTKYSQPVFNTSGLMFYSPVFNVNAFGAIGTTSTVTITIASPGVVTWTAHGLAANQPILFSTTGTLPTGITAGTTYYVAATGLTANSFQFCAASGCGGGSINTSGSQSGVQTASTNDTLPIQAAATAAAAASGLLYFPCGNYSITTAISATVPNSSNTPVTGQGAECTIINAVGAINGFSYTYGNATSFTSFQNFSLTTNQSGGNTGILLSQAAAIASPAQVPPNLIENVTLRGAHGFASTVDYWGTGLNLSNVSNTTVINYYYAGLNVATPLGTGLNIIGNTGSSTYAVALNILSSVFTDCADGLIYGSFVQGVTVSGGSNFTGCQRGITVPASQTGTLDELLVTGNQFNTISSSIGINTNVIEIGITNNLFIITAANQFGIVLGGDDWQISDNMFNDGVAVNTTGLAIIPGAGVVPSHRGVIIGNAFDTLTNGIVVSASATANIAGNSYQAVTNPVIDNSGAAGRVKVSDFIGGAGNVLQFNDDYQLNPQTIAAVLAITCNAASRGSVAYIHDTVGAAVPTFHLIVAGGAGMNVDSLASCNGTNWVYD